MTDHHPPPTGDEEPRLTEDQVGELLTAVRERQSWTPSGMHVNYGESEDRMRGFNTGYDAYNAGDGPENRDPGSAPDEEPNRSAYLDGWDEGFGFARRQDEENIVISAGAARAVAALIAEGEHLLLACARRSGIEQWDGTVRHKDAITATDRAMDGFDAALADPALAALRRTLAGEERR